MPLITPPEVSSIYTRLLDRVASMPSMVIAFFWGMAEATFFFVVPDVYLGFVALFHPRRALRAAMIAVGGALIGGGSMYALGNLLGSRMEDLLLRIPLIDREMLDLVANQLSSQGLLALVSGPFQGVPYKIYAVQAGAKDLGILAFLLVTVLARLERFLPLTFLVMLVGKIFVKNVQRRTHLVLGVYGLVWLSIYAAYAITLK